MLGSCLPFNLLHYSLQHLSDKPSQDLRQDQPRRADKETSHQPAASECHPCGEAFQTFPHLAVTRRGTSKDSRDPQSASGLHR